VAARGRARTRPYRRRTLCSAADYIGILSLPGVVGSYCGIVVAMFAAAQHAPPDDILRTAGMATLFTGAPIVPLTAAGLILAVASGS
jgi:hypothetical protein